MSSYRVAGELRSGDAVFRCDDRGIAEWNAAAEELTGIAAGDAVGRPCWEVIAGRDDRDGLVCHPGCSIPRLVRQGWPVECRELHVRTPTGRKRIAISTIVVRVGEQPLVLHPMREAFAHSPERRPPAPAPRLTRRQLEILELLATGVRVRAIAARLVVSETTVRNHVRAILVELGAHSQLEAVAKARSLALLDRARERNGRVLA